MLISVWDAERLAGEGSSGDGSGRAIAPEPLQQLPTGAFHFCQFALTRWPEEVAGKENENNSSGSGSGSPSNDGGARPGRETDGCWGHREGKRQEHGTRGGEQRDPAPPAPATAPASMPTPPPPPGGAGREARMEEPCTSDNSAFQENIMLAPCGEQHSVSKSLFFSPTALCTYGARLNTVFVAPSMTTVCAQCANRTDFGSVRIARVARNQCGGGIRCACVGRQEAINLTHRKRRACLSSHFFPRRWLGGETVGNFRNESLGLFTAHRLELQLRLSTGVLLYCCRPFPSSL